MYNVRGWKASNVHEPAVLLSSSSVGMSIPNSNRICGQLEEEEVDGAEANDVAAPLPSDRLASGDKQQKGCPQPKGISAKDKRRIREKRRSTGVATLTGHEADELTTRNTTLNESAGLTQEYEDEDRRQDSSAHHSNQCTSSSHNGKDSASESVNCEDRGTRGAHPNETGQSQQPFKPNNSLTSALHNSHHENVTVPESSMDRLRLQENAKSTSTNARDTTAKISYPTQSSESAKNFYTRPFEAKRGILKSSAVRPVIATKPEMLHSSSAKTLPGGHRSDEEIRLSARVRELEMLLESEQRENGLMKRLLSDRDSKIRELELQIAALNEDLDLADEDYLRLEEDNVALARALSQLKGE